MMLKPFISSVFYLSIRKSCGYFRKLSMTSPFGLNTEKVHESLFGVSSDNEQRIQNLILLNSESMSVSLAQMYWDGCFLKLCADGGANRLHDGLGSLKRTKFIPSYIVGDLDSVRSDVLEGYRLLGTEVIRDPDQEDGNDLDKCLQIICQKSVNTINNHLPSVIILGAYGGRYDQEVASMHALYKWSGLFEHMVLLGERCTTFLLEPGRLHKIRVKVNDDVVEGPTCGLIPLGGKVNSVTTTGLVWNLQGEPLEMGVRISTSNSIAPGATEVTVITSEPILWTCENKFLNLPAR